MSSMSSTKDARSCQSISNNEFLLLEKTCEALKDSDEEIKLLFNEINKLSNNKDLGIENEDDIELILKRAEDIAHETKNLLKSPISNSYKGETIPEIKVFTPDEGQAIKEVSATHVHKKDSHVAKQTGKENVEIRRKTKTRPFSAGVIDSKKKEDTKASRFASGTPKKINNLKHDQLLEELKDTNERVKSIELLNVQLTDDNKILKQRLQQLEEQKQLAELKSVECERFVNRLAKEYHNKEQDFKTATENEKRVLSDLYKERNERKNLTVQHEKDVTVIQDLQRQVKEMEMILKRKHPDSVSALIVASKASSVEDNKKKLLEERIQRLELELKDKESHFQSVLLTLQDKFGDMKQKYESHIVDVERKLMEERKLNNEMKNKINKSNLHDAAVQTVPKNHNTVASQTFIKPDRASSAVSRLTQNSTLIFNKLKEDSYLIATIKGLQTELTAKQRTILKINRETEELKKNLRNLQKEKEILLNLNPQKKTSCKPAKSVESVMMRVTNEIEAELFECRKQKDALVEERAGLLASLKRTNEDLIMLKKKRIQDLHTLQIAHEKELMQMNMQLYPLQEEIKLLNRTVEILQERLRSADDKLVKYQAGLKDEMYGGGDNGGSRSTGRSIPASKKNSIENDR
ncbi:centrosomal protein of 162 kDa isoform X1 [Leptidea sinapis]|uniref:centrosomal protein of 162 kDa isoform X1 n=1 Tax=Leptidea sinapis TaxID=189913 RepID=UPI00213B8F04|nr:centrosomal protein of 162 kDa isoform X1 [Leptidea sinapis]